MIQPATAPVTVKDVIAPATFGYQPCEPDSVGAR